MEEEKNEDSYITYWFDNRHTYIINSETNGGKTFYHKKIEKKGFDGQTITHKIQVRFAKCEPVPNGTIIKIKRGMEDWYINPKDKYNIVPVFVIFDYEIVRRSDYAAEQAIQNYNNSLQNYNNADESYSEDLPF